MARKRLISPEFFSHGELYDAEARSGLPLRLAFAGLWTAADRRGLFAWKPRELKLTILPYDAIDFGAVLSALESAGFLERYSVGGKEFGRIPSFSRWQSFHKHEKPSDVPEPLGCSEPSNGCREPSREFLQDGSSTAITASTSSTVTSASAVEDVDDSAPDSVQVPEPRELTALYLVIWCNGAITERWGEQPSPLHVDGRAVQTAEDLRAAGVEWGVARASCYRQMRETKLEEPPHSVNYFRKGILADWKSELSRRAGVQSGERPPPRPRVSGAPGIAARAYATTRGAIEDM